MRFERSHLILLAGFITVFITVASNVFRTMFHPMHPVDSEVSAILAIFESIFLFLGGFVAYGLIFGLPFLSSFLIVKQKYLYAGIGSVIMGLFYTIPIINNAISYAPLSWIGMLGVGIVLLSNLGTGVIALIIHRYRFQSSTMASYMLCGIQLTSALIVPITLVTYWTTGTFYYL